jgi:nicotinamide-nucleotide amidase
VIDVMAMTNPLPPAALSADDHLAASVGDELASRGEKVAVVESTAGGLVSARLLSVPGASLWFDRGVVAYGGNSKLLFTGVDSELLRSFGAVSPEAVTAMATGMRERAAVAWAVAESGIAGPQGSRRSPKPAGFVSIAVVGPDVVRATEHQFEGSRIEVMAQIAEQCLRMLLDALSAATESP